MNGIARRDALGLFVDLNRGIVVIEGDDFADQPLASDQHDFAQCQRNGRSCMDDPAGDLGDGAGGVAHGVYIPLSALRHSGSSRRERASKLLSKETSPTVTMQPPAIGATEMRASGTATRSRSAALTAISHTPDGIRVRALRMSA